MHVCIPLYHGIPKEMQVGWSKMGPRGIQEWDNTTDISPFQKLNSRFDKKLYCGTCGRVMVKGRRTDSNLHPDIDPTSRKIKLV